METEMGAVETNFSLTPRIATSSLGILGSVWLVHESGMAQSAERWVLRPDEVAHLVSNAVLSTPPIVAYSISSILPVPDTDIEVLARAEPFGVVAMGSATLKAGTLPEASWDL